MKRILLSALLLAIGAAAVAKDGRGYLGVKVAAVQNVNDGDDQNGVFIGSVYAGSGAEAAGVREEDRIAAVDGRRVRTLDDLEGALANTRPGDVVKLEVVRVGRPQHLRVTLGEEPAGESRDLPFGEWVDDVAFGDNKFLLELAEGRPRLGVMTQDLRPQLAEFFGVKRGVLLAEVSPDGSAREAGLQAGDVILELDGRAIGSTRELDAALAKREPGDRVDVTVQGRDGLQVLSVELREMDVAFGNLEVALQALPGLGTSANIELIGDGATLSFTRGTLTPAGRTAETIEREIAELERRLEALRAEMEIVRGEKD